MLLLCVCCVHAAKKPKAVSDARKAVVSILVYNDGNLLRSGTGVFVGEKGELLTSYTLFLGADSAVTIDTSGKVRNVERVIGADDIYDCLKLRVAWDKKINSLPVAEAATPDAGALYLLSYGVKNSGVIEELTVSKTDNVSGKAYYTFSFPMQERYVSAPVVNGSGELVALMQQSSTNDSIYSYGVAASMANELCMTALAYNSDKFKGIGIARALPDTQKEAVTLLYLINNVAYGTDEAEKAAFFLLLEDYIAAYPDSYEGYLIRVNSRFLDDDFFVKAQADWARALKVADKPDDVHYNISRTYNAAAFELAKDSAESKAFSDSALHHIDLALAIKNEPLYIQFKGQMLENGADYAAAFECYTSLSSTSLRSADNFVRAASCKEQLGDTEAAIAYMDSAVAVFGTLPVMAMAPYVIERAILKHSMGRAREAVLDYNLYEQLSSGNLNSRFYYAREQAEYDAKMFQQALNDIETALSMCPDDYAYLIEKGRLCYRVKMVDEAIDALVRAQALVPEEPNVYYILSRCYTAKNDAAKAKEYMQKAKECGHPDAENQLNSMN